MARGSGEGPELCQCGLGEAGGGGGVRSRGSDGEAVGLPAIVHASGDQTRLGFLSGSHHPWDACLL
jgi:hypothetical protein